MDIDKIKTIKTNPKLSDSTKQLISEIKLKNKSSNIQERAVFFVSEQTGITAQTLGKALLTQFEGVEFTTVFEPFVNTVSKAKEIAKKIDKSKEKYGYSAIIFCTFTDEKILKEIEKSSGVVYDFFQRYIAPLEKELGIKSNHSTGKSHGLINSKEYNNRIDCINFALYNDDGANLKKYNEAELILVGVSRTGKTPTSLYLALHFGILVANFPLTDEHLDGELPRALKTYKNKIVGLVIDPAQLQKIRNERRSSEHYSSLQKCAKEINSSYSIFEAYDIPYVDATSTSIEEIATFIIKLKKLNLNKI